MFWGTGPDRTGHTDIWIDKLISGIIILDTVPEFTARAHGFKLVFILVKNSSTKLQKSGHLLSKSEYPPCKKHCF